METSRVHKDMLGEYLPKEAVQDGRGYIDIHDNGRYSLASNEQLRNWLESQIMIVRNAAAHEIALRNRKKMK